MSEFSESYHIRTDEPDVTVQKLIDAGISGMVLAPQNGWLTFVPYELPDASRTYHEPSAGKHHDPLIEVSGQPVLWYYNQEDFGWGFDYKRPKFDSTTERAMGFACWLDPEQNVEDDAAFDIPAFCKMLDRPDLAEPLKSVIRFVELDDFEMSDIENGNADIAEYEDSYSLGCRFGELLKLPAYEWIAGQYLQENSERLAELGGRKIGEDLYAQAQAKTAAPAPKLSLWSRWFGSKNDK